jgi:hypothetical protein
LGLHAEVKALQNQLGLSYKDAAHRLYMAEIQKVRTNHDAHTSFSSTTERIDNTVINDMLPAITKIDTGEYEKTQGVAKD